MNDLPIIIHRDCGLPMYLEPVVYDDEVGLTWACPYHGPVPVVSAAIYTGAPTGLAFAVSHRDHCKALTPNGGVDNLLCDCGAMAGS